MINFSRSIYQQKNRYVIAQLSSRNRYLLVIRCLFYIKQDIFTEQMRLKAVVLLLLLAVLAIADYDKYLGRDLLFYAGATYRLKTAKVWQWTYSSTYPLVDGADFSSDKYHLYGYTGYSSKLKAIIVAMRGTVLSFKNLKTDLDYYQVTYPKNPSAKVHRSFYGGCKAIETALRQNLASITKKYPNAPIYVTGHSLGGALAVLSAAQLIPSYKITAVYTYGQPRVGDQKLAAYLNSVLSIYRIINNRDPIPTIPPKQSPVKVIGDKIKNVGQKAKSTAKKAWSKVKGAFHHQELLNEAHESYLNFNYFHEGTEVWYVSSEKAFHKCQSEQPNCSRSTPITKLNVNDHKMSGYYKTLSDSISQNWAMK